MEFENLMQDREFCEKLENAENDDLLSSCLRKKVSLLPKSKSKRPGQPPNRRNWTKNPWTECQEESCWEQHRGEDGSSSSLLANGGVRLAPAVVAAARGRA